MYGDQLMANAIATGKGYPQQVLAEASGAAGSGNQAVNTGLATTASGASTMGTPYQWSGLGLQGYGQQGQIMNAGFQNELDAARLKNESSSGWGAVLGTVASFIPGFAEGGVIPDDEMAEGEMVPQEASPSNGAIPDDIDAEISPSGRPAKINAGEFIVPKDVVSWLGEKGMQQFILKARKEMGNPDMAPAQPETGPPPDQGQPPPIPGRGVGAIPEPMEGMA